MYVAKWTAENGWKSEGVQPYANLSMPPSATVLNYGQALFEGMKALTSAKGRHVLFRPLMNAQRMRAGAQRMSMEEIPEKVFLQGIKELVTANTSHVRRCQTVLQLDSLTGFTPRTLQSQSIQAISLHEFLAFPHIAACASEICQALR